MPHCSLTSHPLASLSPSLPLTSPRLASSLPSLSSLSASATVSERLRPVMSRGR